MTSKQNQHVIVTGGAGFIGSHLCEALLNKGYAVTAIDSLITGRVSNLRSIEKNLNFQFVRADICKPLSEKELPFLKTRGLAGLLHFACPASPVDFERLGYEILNVDSVGTFQMVELALQYNARFLLASTSEIYGDPEVSPQSETYFGNVNPVGPRACYDEAKRFSEAIVSTYQRGCFDEKKGTSRKPQLNAGIVRIFNTYGPRMRLDDGRLIPSIALAAMSQRAVPINGSGSQTRSLCYVDDLVSGIISLFESDFRLPVNLGNPDERSILEIVRTASEVLGQPLKWDHLPHRENDPMRRCPDISRAKSVLQWTPKVSLMEGLQRTFASFREEKEISSP